MKKPKIRKLRKEWRCACGRRTWKATKWKGFQVCVACYRRIMNDWML